MTDWDGGVPRPLNELWQHAVNVNQVYHSRDQAVLALCELAETKSRRHTFKSLPDQTFYGRFTKSCLKVRCVSDACPFRITISSKNDAWTVRESKPHTCDPHELQPKQSRSAYQPTMLASLITPRIMEGLSVSTGDIKEALSPYLRVEPSQSFLKRVRDCAFTMIGGDEIDALKMLPEYVRRLEELGHSASILSVAKGEMVDIAVQAARDNHDRESRTTEFDAAQVRKVLNDSAASITTDFFYAVLFVSKVAKAMFPLLVPVISAHAAPCASPSASHSARGTMFCAYGSDVAHRQVLLSMMLVADVESEKTWSHFLEFTARSLHADWGAITVVTGDDRGVRGAMRRHMPGAKLFFCSMVRKAQVGKRCDTATKKAFALALGAWTMRDLNMAKQKYTATGSAYIGKIADEEQYPLMRGSLYGRGMSEGMGDLNTHFKSVGETNIAAAFIKAVEGDQKRQVDASRDVLHLPDDQLSQRVKGMVEDVERVCAHESALPVTYLDPERTIARVPSKHHALLSYVVNLTAHTCTCGKWQGLDFPCVHAARVCRDANIELSSLLSVFNLTTRLKQQYAGCDYVLPCTSDVAGCTPTVVLTLPLAVPPPRGRPRKRRRVGDVDDSEAAATKPFRCSRCGSFGHNVRTCPTAAPGTTAPPVV